MALMADILEIVNGAIVNKPLTVILCKKSWINSNTTFKNVRTK